MNIFEAIEAGLHDEDLEDIIKAAKARAIAAPLKVGDPIVVNDNVAPKYMQGIKGTVKSVTAKKQRGNPVYLIKVDESEAWKLGGTKMVRYIGGEYKLADINMARDLIRKVG